MKSIRSAALLVLLFSSVTALARELPHSAPALVGMSAERLERLTEAMQSSVENQEFAGSVAIVLRHGEIAYLEAFGAADAEAGTAMQKDSMFRIASMTKAITSVAVMQLFEQGHFLLDQPVAMFLPEFEEMQVAVAADEGYAMQPAESPITIRHLLTHTSGISYRFNVTPGLYEEYVEAGVMDGLGDGPLTLAENVRRIAAMPLAHEPGAAWTYGLNTDVLGRLVEVVSGQPLDEYFAEHIFLPLGMVDTHFRVPATKHERIAAVHRRSTEGGLERLDGLFEDGPVRFDVDYPYSDEIRYLSGGAGITSTAEDYARFLQMLLNGGRLEGTRVLGRKTVELLISDQTEHLAQSAFGANGFSLSFSLDDGPAASGQIGSPGVYGWAGFFSTYYWVDPEEQLVAVLMTQHYPFSLDIYPRFRVLVYAAIDD